MVYPITGKIKCYPLEVVLPEGLAATGAVLSDHVRSVDWESRRAEFIDKAPEDLVAEVLDGIGYCWSEYELTLQSFRLATMTYFQYWGKARADCAEGPQFHLLCYHCLDVAAVGQRWWDKSPVIRRVFARDVPGDQACAWLLLFLALHDLGKFDIRFQLKARDALEALRPDFDFSEVNTRDSDNYYHGPGGYAWFAKDYATLFGKPQCQNRAHFEHWKEWLAAVTGHHGIVPRDGQGSTIDGRFATESVKAYDRSARLEWLKVLEGLFLAPVGLSL